MTDEREERRHHQKTVAPLRRKWERLYLLLLGLIAFAIAIGLLLR